MLGINVQCVKDFFFACFLYNYNYKYLYSAEAMNFMHFFLLHFYNKASLTYKSHYVPLKPTNCDSTIQTTMLLFFM